MKYWLAAILMLLAAVALPLQAEDDYIEGAHYLPIEPPMQTTAPAGQVEVRVPVGLRVRLGRQDRAQCLAHKMFALNVQGTCRLIKD